MNAPRRLISLSPNVSMILFALEADARMVGRTHYCLQSIRKYLQVWRIPESTVTPRLQHWDALPVVGVWPEADPDQVKALQPELILTSSSGDLEAYDANTLGVAAESLINFDTRSLNDLAQHIRQIGQLIDQAEDAEHLIVQLDAMRDGITAKRIDRPTPPTVLFEYCVCIKFDPDPERRFANPSRYVMSGGHLAPELIRLSGGEPLFAQPGDTVKWVAFEDMHEAQPDVVLLFDCDGCPNAQKHPISARTGWSALTAVTRQAVYTLRENISNPNLGFPAALEHLIDIMNDHANRMP